jgi:LysM repeat protein
MYFIKKRRHLAVSTRKGLFLFLILAITLAVWPPVVRAAESDTACVQTYTVVKGDTLNSIARKFSVRFVYLVEANKLKEPYTIFIGQKLCIPKSSKVGVGGTGTEGAFSALSFTVSHTKKGLVITTTNFPEKSNYVVKIDDLSTPQLDGIKIGRLVLKKGGSDKQAYDLPDKLLKATFLQVCLKNQINDQLYCKYSVRYVP